MSLISSQAIKSTKSTYIYLIIIVLMGCSAWGIYQYWGVWLQQSVVWQKALNQGLATLLQATSTDPLYAGSTLVAVSFLYGLLHALGPGHGKLIITTYIATQSTYLKQSVIISLLASLLQGLVAILLVSFVLIIFQLSTQHLNLASQYAEQLSYAFVIILGVMLCLTAIRQWWSESRKKTYRFHHLQTIPSSNKPIPLVNSQVSSSNPAQCDCGHKHVVQEEDLQQNLKAKIFIILSMGLRPCSGALLVLLFSYVIDAYFWGIIAALAMAAGTAITICAIAVFVHFMRYSALRMSQSKGIHLHPYWRIALRLVAGIIFILIGVLMYQSLMMSDVVSPFLSPRTL